MRSDGRLPEVETTLTIRPHPCSAIRGAAARISRSGPRTLSCHCPSQSSSVSSSSGSQERRAGVVDEHVDPAEPLDAGGDDPLAGVRLRDVGGEDLGVARRRLGEPVAVAPDEQQPRALGREQLGGRAADPLLAPVTRQRLPCSPRSMTARPYGVSAATSSAAGRTSPMRATVWPAYSGPASTSRRGAVVGRRRGRQQRLAGRWARASRACAPAGHPARAGAARGRARAAPRGPRGRRAASAPSPRSARPGAAPASRGRTARSAASRARQQPVAVAADARGSPR